MANDFDRIFRENIGAIFLPLVERHLEVEIVESKVLPTKLVGTFEREVDHLFEVRTKRGLHFLLHFEFQTRNDIKMLRRIVLYHGHLYHKYGLPIKHFVIYLGTKPSRMRSELEGPEIFEGFTLLALRREKLADTLRSEVPEEVVTGILNDFEEMDNMEGVRKIIERLQSTIPDENRLGKYLKQLRILSRIRKLDKVVIEEIEKMPLKIDIKEDYLYNRGIAEGREEGRAMGREEGRNQGREEGREEGARDALIDLYSRGILSLSMVAEQLGSTEEEVLDFVEQWKSKK